jgi:hypothetical protein
MADPATARMVVRVSANLEALKQALAEGRVLIDNTTTGLGKLTSSLRGDDLVKAANKWAAAIKAVEGVTKLTSAEQQKANVIFTQAAEKLALMGKGGEAATKEFQRLAAETTRVKEATVSVQPPTQSLIGQIGVMAGGFLTAQAAIGLFKGALSTAADFVRDSVGVYMQAEAAAVKLTGAMRAQGTATPELVRRNVEMAEAYTRTTAYSKDAVVAAQTLMIEIGGVMPSMMKQATDAALDLASGLGIDLDTSARLVGKAFAGNTDTLAKYGIIVNQSAVETQGMGAVLDAIQRKVGGQAQAELESYAGRVKQVANAWEDVKESVGKAVLTDPLIELLFRTIREGAMTASGEVETTSRSVSNLVGFLVPDVAGVNQWLVQLAEDAADAQNVLAHLEAQIARTVPPLPQTTGDTADRARIAAETAKLMADWTRDSEQAKAAAKKYAAEIQQIHATMFGEADIAQALKYVAAIGNVSKLSGMTADNQKALNAVLQKAIDQYNVLGRTAPKTLLDMYVATLKLQEVSSRTLLPGEAIPGATPMGLGFDIDQASKLAHIEQYAYKAADAYELLTQKGSSFWAFKPTDAPVKMLRSLTESLRDWIGTIPQLIQQAFTGGGGLAGAAKAGLSGVGAIFGKDLGASITKSLGLSITTSTTGALISGFTTAMGAIGPALMTSSSKMGQAIGSAITGALMGATIGMMKGSVGGPWGAAIGAAVGLSYGVIKASFQPSAEYVKWKNAETDANQKFADIQEKYKQTYGSLANIAKIGSTIGIDLITAFAVGGKGGPGTAGLENLNTVADEFTKKYNELQTAIKKYSIVFDDLTDTARAREIANTTAALASETEVLRTYGVTEEAILKRMAPAYEDLLTSALRTGDKLPLTLKPMLLEMARLGLLTEDTKRKLLGLGDVTVGPTFEEVSAIATKYGMDTSKLGGAYAQMQGTATGGQIVKDIETMVAGGMNRWQVVGQMNPQISALVEQALTYKTALPAELEPIIRTMAQWGPEFLAGSTGQNLRDDLANLKFADPVVDATQQQTEALVAAIDALPWEAASDPIISATEGQTEAIVGAIDRLAESIDRGLTLTSATAPYGTSEGGERADRFHAGGLVMDAYHSGGMVWARAMTMMPHFSSGGEVPAWLLPGEGVLSRNVGMPAVGGRAGLDALNRGSSGGINVVINIDRPVLRDRQAINELADQIVRVLPSRLRLAGAL